MPSEKQSSPAASAPFLWFLWCRSSRCDTPEEQRRTTKKNNEEIRLAHNSFCFRWKIPNSNQVRDYVRGDNSSLPQAPRNYLLIRYVMLDEERSKYGHYLQKLLLCNKHQLTLVNSLLSPTTRRSTMAVTCDIR
eukprot:scaffold5126_cov70-Skeletonema_dohrnii-CCMP3373.AAC.2